MGRQARPLAALAALAARQSLNMRVEPPVTPALAAAATRQQAVLATVGASGLAAAVAVVAKLQQPLWRETAAWVGLVNQCLIPVRPRLAAVGPLVRLAGLVRLALRQTTAAMAVPVAAVAQALQAALAALAALVATRAAAAAVVQHLRLPRQVQAVPERLALCDS